MLFQNNFSQSDYLSSYDLLNKYTLTTLYEIPKIKNVVIDFPLANFLKAYDFNKLSSNDKEIQIKAFLFFYFLNGSIPFINNKVASLIRNSEKTPESNAAVKIKISNSNLLNQFLVTLFIENWSRVIKEDVKILPDSSLQINTSTFNIKTFCPASTLFEVDNFLTTVITNINSKEFFISLNFLITQSKELKHVAPVSIIKNLPLFWING